MGKNSGINIVVIMRKNFPPHRKIGTTPLKIFFLNLDFQISWATKHAAFLNCTFFDFSAPLALGDMQQQDADQFYRFFS